MLADLHIHTTFSDGIYTPQEIVEQAVGVGLKAIAITDHENLKGYDVARAYIAQKKYDLQLLRGVEMDTNFKGKDVHVLGFHFSPDSAPLVQALAWNRVGRIGRVEKIIEKIDAMGYPLTFKEVRDEANGAKSLGRPHIARVLVKKGLFPNVQAVFDKLIASGKPCYVRQVKMSPMDAAKLIANAGGIAVLAHPAEINNPALVEEILDSQAFAGMEVWHPSTLKEKVPHDWLSVARNHHLLTSGGSDLHGNPGRFPTHLGEFRIQYEDVAGIIKAGIRD